ncbi:MAG TPA: chemotaxis protein CheW [Stellaceae bacterium]|jgi:purine-binding chemotaxis protein CheW|nr:chemotaxis protein CheW [Stellaceae bacterium]
MREAVGVRSAAVPAAGASNWIVFSLGDEQFAVPMASTGTVLQPPALAVVPHGPPALLGAGNLGGQIVPIVDFARLLDRQYAERTYDGSGAILEMRTRGGNVGMWVDRVERVVSVDAGTSLTRRRIAGRDDETGGISLIDPTPLLIAGLAPPSLAAGATAPLGELADRAQPSVASTTGDSFVMVEIAGRAFELSHAAVLELVEAVQWTRIPRSPAGLFAVGVLRGVALPILSLAPLLGLPEMAAPGSFAVVALGRQRVLLAVDRVVGLRFREHHGRLHLARGAANQQPADRDAEPIDLDRMIPEALHRIVSEFSTTDEAASDAAAIADAGAGYLTFGVAEQDFAVPIAAVDRIVGAQPMIKLPQTMEEATNLSHVVGAIELRGQIVPVAALRSRLGIPGAIEPAAGSEPAAYVILRGRHGLGAIAVDQVKQVASLPADRIAPPPAENTAIDGVIISEAGEVLRVLAPDRLWSVA